MKKKTKQRLMAGASVVLFAAAGFFGWKAISREYQIRKGKADNSSLREYVMDESRKEFNGFARDNYSGGADDDTGTGAGKYVSPIDWEKLWGKNEDAAAWLEIPNTEMSFPIVLREGDDSYYLNRDFNKDWSIYGAAFLENYNKKDFSDECSVVYGHDISNGEWFGELQTIFTDPDRFDECRDMTLYLPEEERTYRVFAAVPYGTKHILHYTDFSKEKDYKDFIKEISETRALNAVVDEDELPEYGTRLLILSTCLKGDYSHRFLVLARESR